MHGARKYFHLNRKLAFDHKYRTVADLDLPYGFSSADQLLVDFNDADRVLREVKSK